MDPFTVKGELEVINSATVMCLRQNKSSNPDYICKTSFGQGDIRHPFLSGLFKEKEFDKYSFVNGWEILVGQNEVINYLRSTPEKMVTMRYAGEFKLAGGNQDKGETLEDCAKRELYEEFLRPLGQSEEHDICLRLFSVKQTRPIRSRSNLMHNYICLADENPFLQNLDIDAVNSKLKERRRQFREKIKTEEYWKLSQEEKELISPEVHKLEWMPVSKFFKLCLSSMIPNSFVNDWQKEQFKAISKDPKKIRRRDPMFMTGATVVEVDIIPGADILKLMSRDLTVSELAKNEQWLFKGMKDEEVKRVTGERLALGVNPSFLSPKRLEDRRKEIELKYKKSSLSKL